MVPESLIAHSIATIPLRTSFYDHAYVWLASPSPQQIPTTPGIEPNSATPSFKRHRYPAEVRSIWLFLILTR
jgi:hypothetical protein